MNAKIYQRIIQTLKNKIRQLQRQIEERTRNFLLHKGMKNIVLRGRQEKQIQTDKYEYILPSRSAVGELSPNLFLNTEQHIEGESEIKTSRTFHIKKFDIFEQDDEKHKELSEKKQKLFDLLQSLVHQHQKKQQNLEDSTMSISIGQQQQPASNTQQKNIQRQLRRAQRQLKKIVAKYQFEKQVSQYAKQGLLISEEENYRFRLKIKQLQKRVIDLQSEQVFQSIQSPQEEQKLKQFLQHEKQVKQEYLDTCLKLEEEMNILKRENQNLHAMIAQLIIKKQEAKQQAEDIIAIKQQPLDQEKETIKIDFSIFEQLKDISFSISNCIPVVSEQDINYFRPEDEIEMLQALKRVQQYCKQIEKWQIQRLEIVNKEKAAFIDFLQKISSNLDASAKQKLSLELKNMQQMGHYLQIFKLNQKSIQLRNQALIQNQLAQLSHNDEPQSLAMQ